MPPTIGSIKQSNTHCILHLHWEDRAQKVLSNRSMRFCDNYGIQFSHGVCTPQTAMAHCFRMASVRHALKVHEQRIFEGDNIAANLVTTNDMVMGP